MQALGIREHDADRLLQPGNGPVEEPDADSEVERDSARMDNLFAQLTGEMLPSLKLHASHAGLLQLHQRHTVCHVCQWCCTMLAAGHAETDLSKGATA